MVSCPDVHAPASQKLRLPPNADHRPALRTNFLTSQSSYQTPTSFNATLDNAGQKRAQAFTTGSEAAGYELSSIGFRFKNVAETAAASKLTATLTEESSGNPGSDLCTLTNPTIAANAVNTFTAPTSCPILAANTTYFFVLERSDASGNSIGVSVTSSGNEDSTPATGWSISNDRHYSTGSWGDTSGESYLIEVKGVEVANSPATGAPAISGPPQAGHTLTADTSGIIDEDGKPDDDGGYAYQWIASEGGTDADIAGADGQTYTLTASEAGKRIKVRVSFTDGGGFVETLTSAAMGPVAAASATSTRLWAGTMTVGGGVGYESTLDPVVGSLDDDGFTDQGTDYTVKAVVRSPAGLVVSLDPLPGAGQIAAWTLTVVGDDFDLEFELAEASPTPTLIETETAYVWANPGLSWSDGDEIFLALQAVNALVSNTGQDATHQYGPAAVLPKSAQGFTTGTNNGGYTLSSIGVSFGQIANTSTAASRLTATLNEASGSNPGDVVCTLEHPSSYASSGVNTYGAPATGENACPTLAASTTYFFVLERTDFSGGDIELDLTDSTDEDATSAPGWSIANWYRIGLANTWANPSVLNRPMMIQVRGAAEAVNFPPTGQVTIDGTFLENEILTANTSAIEDANGLTGVSYSYQWTRSNCTDSANDGDISGATGSTHRLTATDVTCVLIVKVTFEDDAGFEHELTDTAYSNPAAVAVTLVAEGDGVTVDYGTIPVLKVQEEAGNVRLGLRAVTDGDSRPVASFQITVQSQDDTAEAGRDFQSFSQTFSFAPFSFREESGRYVHTVWKTLSIVDDAVTEKTEQFPLQIGEPTHADVTLKSDSAVVYIQDNDVTTLSLTCLPANEGESITVRITPDTPVSFPFTLVVSTVDGTAVEGSDYTGYAAVDLFESLLAEETFTITTREDINDDGDKTFGVVLDRNGLDVDILIGNDRVDCTIRDNGITPPGGPTVTASPRDRGLFVTWTVPDDGGRPTNKYQVQWKTGDEGFSNLRRHTVDSREDTIGSLGNNKRYLVRVRASNNGGAVYGDWSSAEEGSPRPLRAPTDFFALWLTRLGDPPVYYHKTQNTLTVSWFVVRGATEYQVEYRRQGETDWTRVSGYFDHLPSTTRGHRPVAVATGLDCDTEYDLRVRARNQDDPVLESLDGWTPYAYTQARTAPCAEPDRITNVLATLDPQCADLSWTAPTAGQPTGYRIERYFLDTPNGAWETIEDNTGRAATYRDCSQEYEDHEGGVAYYITALGAEGFGATQILYKEPSGQPDPPRNVRLTRDNQFVRTLEWDQAPEAWRTTVLAGREGGMRNSVVADLWPTWYQVERREFTGDPEGDWSFPDGSIWEVMRSAAEGNTSRTYTDNEDRGSRLYVYRVIPYNSVWPGLVLFDDWAFDGPTYTRTLDNVQGDGQQQGNGQQQDPAPTVSSASITSSPGADAEYAIGGVVEATVTFSEAVNVTGSPGLTLSIGGQSRTAGYARGSSAAALVFAHTVQEGDRGAVSIGASAVSLNGGSINAVDDGQAATLTHAAVTASGHAVDGVRPALGSAAVNGAVLTLAYSEALDGNSTPAPGAFTVSVAGAARSVSGVSVSGSQASLTLATAAENGDTVTVGYAAPDASRLRDRAGNAASSFSGQAATNDTEAAANDAGGGDGATPLTAASGNVPEAHDGETPFTFELRFSEEVALSYLTLQNHAFSVTNGTVTKAKRLTQGSNIGWSVTATPGSDADVTLVLAVTTDCNAAGAVCTDGGKQLSAALTLTVPGPEPPQQQNSPATGAPTISGAVQVEETLTAETSGIADEDGLTNATFTYQWVSNDGNVDSDIQDASDSTYELTDDDQGKTIKVRVSFTDGADNEETLTSAATTAVEPAPNSPATGQPDINGTVQVGETLTANVSGIDDADGLDDAVFSYQWTRNDGTADTHIQDARDSTYVLDADDEGTTIKVRVTFTDDRGHGETLTSAATDAVAGPPSEPLTVSLENEADTHDGETPFTFELRFSEEFHLSYTTLRDHAFTVAGGKIEKAQRLTKGSNIHWRITVQPDSNADVTITLPATGDCGDTGAICTGDGRKLSNRLELTVSGPDS